MSKPDYFEFFGIERKLALDLADLESRFHQLSRQLHPDRYVRATPAERERALEASATLNDAYRTLRDPLSRAEYVLRDQPSEKGSQQFLAEMFDLSEAVDELDARDPNLAKVREALLALRAASDKLIDGESHKLDSGAETSYRSLRAAVDRRKYVDSMLRRLETKLAI